MDTTITEGRSISKPPYFDGTNCDEWKERIKIFIQSVDFKLWLVIKNGSKIPKKIINGEELVKSEDEFNDEDMKIMEQEAKAKYILSCALNSDDLKRISSCQTAKEMWEELDKLSISYIIIFLLQVFHMFNFFFSNLICDNCSKISILYYLHVIVILPRL
jgi:ABC-type bacteriocin/lantibiotic exporter with double-glycine peptidase domain